MRNLLWASHVFQNPRLKFLFRWAEKLNDKKLWNWERNCETEKLWNPDRDFVNPTWFQEGLNLATAETSKRRRLNPLALRWPTEYLAVRRSSVDIGGGRLSSVMIGRFRFWYRDVDEDPTFRYRLGRRRMRVITHQRVSLADGSERDKRHVVKTPPVFPPDRDSRNTTRDSPGYLSLFCYLYGKKSTSAGIWTPNATIQNRVFMSCIRNKKWSTTGEVIVQRSPHV